MTAPSSSACPSCGAAAAGRFCSTCGTPLEGAACAACAAPLTPGAHYCHRCGAPAGPSRPVAARSGTDVLPWAVAAIALVALIALVVGQRFGARDAGAPAAGATEVLDGANGQGSTVISAPEGAPGGAMPRAPDISQLTPGQRAERLYDRIMREHEAGHDDNVRTFMPMAVAAYEMLGTLNLDQRYDLGRLGEVAGDTALARAQADTILRERPAHLLGLILAAQAARMVGNEPHAEQFDARLLSVAPRESKAKLPEYLLHATDIDAALAAARAKRRTVAK